AEGLLTIGRLSWQIGDYHEATLALGEALRAAESICNDTLQFQTHELLAATYKSLGNSENALFHHEQFAAIRDKVTGFIRQQAIAELQARYDLERAEREMQIVRLEKERLALELEMKTKELTSMALRLVEKNQ